MNILSKVMNSSIAMTVAIVVFALGSSMATVDAQSVSQLDNLAGSSKTEISKYVMDQYAVDQAMAPIKTRQEFIEYQKNHATDSPLDKLTPMNRQLFIKSLMFGNGGVSNLRYDVFEGMSPTDVYKILALFGDQVLVPHLHLHGRTALDREIMSPNEMIGPFKMHYACTGTNSGTCTKDDKQACNTATC